MINRITSTAGLTPNLGGSATSYSYDKADRIQFVGGITYTVDLNGNLTGIATSPNATAYAYDHANRLKTATVGGVTSSYVYDGDGKRISKTVGTNPTVSYAYDVNGSLPEVLTDGTLDYVYGLGLAYTISTNVTHTLQVMQTDGLGSVRAITDASGNLLQTFQTDEFGNQAMTQGANTEPFRYTGQQLDSETSLYDLRARYYMPSIGRFVSGDQFFGSPVVPLSLNRFNYTESNPAGLSDPSGHGLGGPRQWLGLAAAGVAWAVSNAGAIVATVNRVLSGSYGQSTLSVEEELTAAGIPGAEELLARAQAGDEGALRVLRAVQQVGPQNVAGFEVSFRTSTDALKADIVDAAGNLIEVGGPSKGSSANALSDFGSQIARYARVASDLGTTAKFYYDEGTPQEALNIAIRRLGAENVIPIKPP